MWDTSTPGWCSRPWRRCGPTAEASEGSHYTTLSLGHWNMHNVCIICYNVLKSVCNDSMTLPISVFLQFFNTSVGYVEGLHKSCAFCALRLWRVTSFGSHTNTQICSARMGYLAKSFSSSLSMTSLEVLLLKTTFKNWITIGSPLITTNHH